MKIVPFSRPESKAFASKLVFDDSELAAQESYPYAGKKRGALDCVLNYRYPGKYE